LLRNGPPDPAYAQALLQELAARYQQAREFLRAALPDEVAAAAAPGDAGALRDLAAALDRRLDQGEEAAFAAYDELLAALDERGRLGLRNVGRRLADYDFPGARQALRALAGELGIQLERRE
jgi:hypothetical protein